jgi:hypothetical protein
MRVSRNAEAGRFAGSGCNCETKARRPTSRESGLQVPTADHPHTDWAEPPLPVPPTRHASRRSQRGTWDLRMLSLDLEKIAEVDLLCE